MADTHTIGWSKLKPKTLYERLRLPRQCFLLPEGTPYQRGRPSYPICSKTGEVACAGLQAAYRRLMMYKSHYPPELVRRMARKIIETARKYADPSDPMNVCNFVFRAERHLKQLNLLGGVGQMAKLRPGACKRTKKGVYLCNIPGVGARFVGKTRMGDLGEVGEIGGVVRHCVRYKRTRAGLRCAEYAPGPSPLGEYGDIGEIGSIRGRRCVRYKRVYSPALGRYIRRCAKYA